MADAAKRLYLVEGTGGQLSSSEDYSHVELIGDLYRPIISSYIDKITSDSTFNSGYQISSTGSVLRGNALSDVGAWGGGAQAGIGTPLDLATFEAFQAEMRNSIAAIAGRLSTMEVSAYRSESRDTDSIDYATNDLDVGASLALLGRPVEGERWARLLDKMADQEHYSLEVFELAIEGLAAKSVATRCAAARVVALAGADQALSILAEHLEKETSSVARSVISSVKSALVL